MAAGMRTTGQTRCHLQLQVADSIGFKADFRQWEHLLRIGE